MTSVHQWSRRLGFDSRSSHTKTQKMVLMPPLSILRYGSRVIGENQGKEKHPLLHRGICVYIYKYINISI